MANHMADVAKMLGVELNEKFEVDVGGIIVKAQITTDNIHLLNYDRHWGGYSADALLKGLLCGNYTIKRKPWKPKYNEHYFSVGPGGVIEPGVWINDFVDRALYKLGNCYQYGSDAELNKDKWIAFYASDEVLEV